MRVLYIGEVVGSSGVFCVKKLLPLIKQEHRIDFTIAGGDGATGGYGTGKNHAVYLRKLGVDVLTGGECIYYKLDMVTHLETTRDVLRPANYGQTTPGYGFRTYAAKGGDIAVVVLLGQAGFERVHLENPFVLLPRILEQLSTRTVIVDFHAFTSAEKQAMFYHAGGTVSAVVGSHTKVQTADERIMNGGTAVITDAGRTGSLDSVGGLEPSIEIGKLRSQIPERSKAAWKRLELEGVVIDIARDGRATSIERLRIPCDGAPDDSTRNDT